jgi:hypothetical protein
MISRCSEARETSRNRSEWSSETTTDVTHGAYRRTLATSIEATVTSFLVGTAPRVKIVGGRLERILAKRDNPAREALLWHNGYFGRGRRTIMIRSGITAVNSPLLHTTELLNEILQYAYIPKDVVKAYKVQAAVMSKATKKR